jgi:hypothetical protein
VYAAEEEGAWWLITDEGSIGAFLDDEDQDLMQRAVKLTRFSSRENWELEYDLHRMRYGKPPRFLKLEPARARSGSTRRPGRHG